jgi:hypothetical protein
VTLKSSLLALALVACGPKAPAPIEPIIAERPQSTLTQSTQDLLWDLRFPVLIHAYLTEPTTPELTPHVAAVKELVAKYGEFNASKIKLDVVDPFDDDNTEAYARDKFHVEPVGVHHTTDQTVETMTVYFSIVIEMGRQVEILDPQDLVDISESGTATLRDVEALITERIRSAAEERTTW